MALSHSAETSIESGVELERAARWLEVSWPDGHRSRFHYVWLRDCCICAVCGDSTSSKRFLLPTDVAPDVAPESGPSGVRLEGDHLAIDWAPYGHRSRYRLDWLRRHCYSDRERARRRHRPVLWDSAIEEVVPEARYAAARDDEAARLDLLLKLRDYGFALLRDGPQSPEGTAEIIALVGDLETTTYAPVFDLSPAHNRELMSSLTREVPPHTDEAFRFAPPGVAVIHCLRPADDGGDSILVDGFQIARKLREEDPAAFALLTHQPQTFHRAHDGALDLRARAPVIRLDEEGEVVGFRFHTRAAAPLDAPSDLIEPLYDANRRLAALMLDPANQFRRQLRPGEAILFDNHRVMHARSAYRGDRHLRLCNASRESFHNNLRLLARRLGRREEADKIMASGVAG